MKKIWKIAVLLLLVANMFVVCTSGKNPAHTYPLVVRVDSFNMAENLVYFVDADGELWTFEGIGDWQRGDVGALLMSDSGTENFIYDDEILDARYGFNMYPEL